jgi:hypothetical protein
LSDVAFFHADSVFWGHASYSQKECVSDQTDGGAIMTYRKLDAMQIFVAEKGSFSAVAKERGIGEPAVSK